MKVQHTLDEVVLAYAAIEKNAKVETSVSLHALPLGMKRRRPSMIKGIIDIIHELCVNHVSK